MMKLTKEDTVGVRPTLGSGAAPPPTPEAFADSIALALQPQFPSMAPEQLAVVGVRMAALRHTPSGEWTNAFLTAFLGKLEASGPAAVVQVIGAAPVPAALADVLIPCCWGHYVARELAV